ncbi:DEAD/DEAH box helicase [Ilumatobacter sp.]|uniref:DEAD/DEAH box helicase n=1 Tax=Ilumatobacter sp. TaxID=1967498 RepID=UPI003B51C36B
MSDGSSFRSGPPPHLPDLPVVEAISDVLGALAERGRAILVAPPGAGKTTVVPLALLDEPWLDGRRIVMLEPRRLATRAAARRMAELTGTDVGGPIGYQTRDERHIGPDTRIEVVTEGILTRRMQRDPELPGVGAVIFDEVHERNLPTDIGLALCLDVIGSIRPDLRLLAMSATPDTEGLVRVLDAPVVSSEGRTFDVEMNWLPRSPTGTGRVGNRGGGGRKNRGPAPFRADAADRVGRGRRSAACAGRTRRRRPRVPARDRRDPPHRTTLARRSRPRHRRPPARRLRCRRPTRTRRSNRRLPGAGASCSAPTSPRPR